MQIRKFIKINKTIILIFLIIEIILWLCFYFFIKLEVTDEIINSYSEININSDEALKVVKNEHKKKLKYGYIKKSNILMITKNLKEYFVQ